MNVFEQHDRYMERGPESWDYELTEAQAAELWQLYQAEGERKAVSGFAIKYELPFDFVEGELDAMLEDGDASESKLECTCQLDYRTHEVISLCPLCQYGEDYIRLQHPSEY